MKSARSFPGVVMVTLVALVTVAALMAGQRNSPGALLPHGY